ncbi:TPA: YopX family protein [Streptococcus suis]
MIPKFRAYNPATNDWYKPEEVFVSDGKINLDDDDFDELIQNNDVNLMQSTGKMDSTGTVIGNIYENPELMEATND